MPAEVLVVMDELEKAGFEAYVVGGCVRDLLLGKVPKDWDVTTNARPEEIQKLFPDSVYENEFGTVGIKIKNQKSKIKNTDKNAKIENAKIIRTEDSDEVTEIVEVTTYRIESKYSDKRHPDEVRFARTLEEDLGRRDFTINALALKSQKSKVKSKKGNFEIVDLFNGRKDLEKKLIRAVGKAEERFDEDALRMMRAVRFSVTLGFEIEKETLAAIKKLARNLKHISQERIRDELEKIILSSAPARGIELLEECGLLAMILPEVTNGIGVTQSHHHYYGPYNTVYKHLVASLDKCPSPKLAVRLAALLHDVGKPQSKRGEGENATFYGHEYISERLTKKILERLRFSRAVIDQTALLVRNHMFYYNVDEVGEAGVRRVVHKVGLENIRDLIDVRIADRLGSGVPKAVPYKLRHFQFMVEKVSHDPVSVKQLKLNGNDLMKELGMAPGPKIGAILAELLSRVIDDPKLNEKDKLLGLARELDKQDVLALRRAAEERIKEEQEREEELIKKKHRVS